jgi:hypothetical protein
LVMGLDFFFRLAAADLRFFRAIDDPHGS